MKDILLLQNYSRLYILKNTRGIPYGTMLLYPSQGKTCKEFFDKCVLRTILWKRVPGDMKNKGSSSLCSNKRCDVVNIS